MTKFKSAKTDKKWIELKDAPPDMADQDHQGFQGFLSDILSSQNLIVLTGLGTSLSIPNAPKMNDLWVAVKSATNNKFDAICQKARYVTPTGGDNIEVLLSHCQLLIQFQDDGDAKAFVAEAEKIIVKKCREFLNTNTALPAHLDFLRRVARRSTRLPRAKIFTTNYDLCFETAASQARFVVVDGFSPANPQSFDGSYFSYDIVLRDQEKEVPEYIDKVFHLYKLHGSVDWTRQKDEIVKDAATEKPLIVYPRGSKYEMSYEQPFLEMMSRLQLALRTPHTGLLIIGFGFNDSHIAQPIISALRSNVKLKAMVVSPDLETSQNQFVKGVSDLADNRDPRVSLLSGSFEWLVPRLPDLIARTEEEGHVERVKALKSI